MSNHDADDWAAIKASQEEINQGYTLLSKYVRHFFSAYLLNDKKSKEKLKVLHQEANVEPDFLNFESKTKPEK